MLEHIYKRKIQLPSCSRQLPRKQLDWQLWQQILALLLQNDSNRKLKYSLGRRDKEVLQYWKWHFSDSCNRLFARHGQVFTEYEMSNRGSRSNTGSYIAINGICETLPDDIKEVNVYKDWSYKIQSYIKQHEHHPMGTDSGIPKTMDEAKNMLSMNDQWTINNMWSQDQGKPVAKDIALCRATRISDGSYKNNRCTAAYILEQNNNAESRIYAVHDIPGSDQDQYPYESELEGISMILTIVKCLL